MKDYQARIIRAVEATGEKGWRLRNMGVLQGTAIKIKGRAPLTGPLAMRVMGFTLTLRNSEADDIEVEVNQIPLGPT